MESGNHNELDYMDDAAFEDYVQEGGDSLSWDQKKAFENALATHTDDTADRCEKIATEVPGKAVDDVVNHYQLLDEDVVAIDGDQIPLPSYSEDEAAGGGDGSSQGKKVGEGKASTAEQERRKGVAWSEELQFHLLTHCKMTLQTHLVVWLSPQLNLVWLSSKCGSVVTQGFRTGPNFQPVHQEFHRSFPGALTMIDQYY